MFDGIDPNVFGPAVAVGLLAAGFIIAVAAWRGSPEGHTEGESYVRNALDLGRSIDPEEAKRVLDHYADKER